jgi:predicted TIM-barrel fold metal-dependent hydrolase
MIIDAVAEFGPGFVTDTPLQSPSRPLNADELVATMDRVGIDRALVHAPRWLGGNVGNDFIDPNYEQANRALAQGVQKHPTRLTGVARVNPKYGKAAAAELERCLGEYAFKGLYLDNAGEGISYADMKMLAPLLEICSSHTVPVMAYTWIAPSQPFQLIQMARAFPKVNFIMVHSGWRLSMDAALVAEAAANIFFETSDGNAGAPRFARQRFPGRVVFGTNYPHNMPEVELQRVRRWGQLNPAQLDEVLGGTIARLIGLQV